MFLAYPLLSAYNEKRKVNFPFAFRQMVDDYSFNRNVGFQPKLLSLGKVQINLTFHLFNRNFVIENNKHYISQ